MDDYITVELQRIKRISPSTKMFRFVTDGVGVPFLAGQFYRFTFTDGSGQFERSYSLCNQLDEEDQCHLDLIVSEVDRGRATQVLFSSSIGLQVRVRGPFGRLVLPQPLPARSVLVATSVGLAPFIPMLSMFAASPPSNDKAMVLFLGVRDREEFLYGQWLLSLHNRLSQFQLFVCYSKETAIDLQPYEHHGYVTDVVAQEHPNPQSDFFMLCGNPQMVDDVFLLLKNLGFSGRNVRREKYIFARQENNSARPKTLSKGDRALLLEKIKRYQK